MKNEEGKIFAINSKARGLFTSSFNFMTGGSSEGVNLLEIMVVVIIMLIIAVLTFPQLTKMVEQGKLKEAHVNLELIRTGEQLYWLDNNFYTGAISSLRIDDPNTDSNRAFDYSVVSPSSPSVDPNNFTARATRRSGPYSGDTRSIQRDGDITNP
jgi:Tfp pilus assembly protein PilE